MYTLCQLDGLGPPGALGDPGALGGPGVPGGGPRGPMTPLLFYCSSMC